MCLIFVLLILQVEPSEHDVIQKRLGNYEVAKRLILSSTGTKTNDLLGVDRQPATPLPSKNANDGFFQKSSRNPNLQKRIISDQTSASGFRKEREKFNAIGGLTDKHHVKLNEKGKDDRFPNKASTIAHRPNVHDLSSSSQKGNNPVQASSSSQKGNNPAQTSSSSQKGNNPVQASSSSQKGNYPVQASSSSQKGHNPVQTKESSHSSTEKPVSSHNPVVSAKTHQYRRSRGESHHRSISPSSVIGSQADKSSAHPEVKESVTQSKPQPLRRDSILSTFGKELEEVNSSASQPKSASISLSDKNDDISKPNKASAKTKPVDSSILKVKEDNRNGMNTFNGRVRPTIHIPEVSLW